MFHHLIRWGAAALLVVSFAQPARALPLDGDGDGFTVTIGAAWEQLVDSVFATWDELVGSCPDGICPGDGGGDQLNDGDSAGSCDPNGGRCR